VLMVGGSIPGETRTIAIAIYDQVQGFNLAAANQMSLALLLLSLLAVGFSFIASARLVRRP
ncbi:MAG: molybdate ABC transporter permease subunit, partial [Polaromonas sp.]|nr:molybdate ABC transporter permease subunit [Polaromonas sp.]